MNKEMAMFAWIASIVVSVPLLFFAHAAVAQQPTKVDEWSGELVGVRPTMDLTREDHEASVRATKIKAFTETTSGVTRSLLGARYDWTKLSAALDSRLAEVVKQAKDDAAIQLWRSVVRVTAAMAEIAAYASMGDSGGKGDGGAGAQHDAAGQPTQTETREMLLICTGRDACAPVDMKRYQSLSGGADVSFTGELQRHFPAVGCGPEFGGGCSGLDGDFVMSYWKKKSTTTIPTPASKPKASEGLRWYNVLKHVTRSIPDAMKPAASLALDALPYTSALKSAEKSRTGRDPITGAEVSALKSAEKSRTGRDPITGAEVSSVTAGAGSLSPPPPLRQTICDLADNGQVGDVRVMVEAGAEIGKLCRGDRMPLDVAVENGKVDVVQFLLSVEAPSSFSDEGMLVYLAAVRNRPQVISALAKAEVSLAFRTLNGKTAIHSAAFAGYGDVVNTLLLAGVDANLPGPLDRTPLHEAARGGHVTTLAILVFHGADPNAVDREGRTAAKLAADAGHLDAVKFFMGPVAPENRTGR